MSAARTLLPLRVTGQLVNLVVIALGIASAYFMTIQSLKVELAAKAESVVVEQLDKKIGNLEVILREGTVSREQFHSFSTDLERRLSRIEYYLMQQRGEDLENR
jgi:hypothetical protein